MQFNCSKQVIHPLSDTYKFYGDNPRYLFIRRSRETDEFDSQGIILMVKDGQKYYHNGMIIQRGLDLLRCYEKQKDLILIYTNYLINEFVHYKECIYIPLKFSHIFANVKYSPPWFSGMTQAMALSFFVRLAALTQNNKYKIISEKIFKSFSNYYDSNMNYNHYTFTYIDDKKNLWFLEAPSPNPVYVLNGFIFGIFGLYDYYMATADEMAKTLLDAAISTLKENLDKFRVPNGCSYYAIPLRTTIASYHLGHIYQLETIFHITKDIYFRQMADLLNDDSKFIINK